ncbi:MAG: hypothetical protein PW788_07620 [Micavibrio sp.]|nr:hypothetical protein [Micavibrio sp.]
MKKFLWILGSIIVCTALGVGFCKLFGIQYTPASGNYSASKPAQMDDSDMKEKMREWAFAGKQLVKTKLRDPDSAQFGTTTVSWGPGGVVMLCGTVNSKNGFGGYGGDTGFISTVVEGVTVFQSNTRDFNKLWKKLCGSKYNEEAIKVWGSAAKIAPLRF